ncbi:MAG: bifunctional folylpolyglutamate synthase/dihydrofolate synthase [Coriobacteriales bacterium]|nr:bifunctional folylpolyglutamate synthase/dihydrofolate synthase [Coriobacteriales bacterium]
MNFAETMKLLESETNTKINPSLEACEAMCEKLGNPQHKYDCIQIAGTNGKTSAARMTAKLLKEAGYKVALYTSPELVRFPERMEIDGEVVSDEQFCKCVEKAYESAHECGFEGATQFELLTVGAFWLFAEEQVDIAVFECGMGGRWDATSVCRPKVAIITGIALDHTAILGDTVEAIAGEKAAIIKDGSVAILAQELTCRQIFVEQAEAVGSPYVDVDPALAEKLEPAVTHMPHYQSRNAAVALTAFLEMLKIYGKSIDDPIGFTIEALGDLQIPGRFETLRAEPLILIDAAHNPQSAGVLATEVESRFAPGSRPALLLGVLADKDARGVVGTLVPLFDRVVVSASKSPMSHTPAELASIVTEVTGVVPEVCPDLASAIELLGETPFIATGSITVAGEVKGIVMGISAI